MKKIVEFVQVYRLYRRNQNPRLRSLRTAYDIAFCGLPF